MQSFNLCGRDLLRTMRSAIMCRRPGAIPLALALALAGEGGMLYLTRGP